jgi:hypothetical protein
MKVTNSLSHSIISFNSLYFSFKLSENRKIVKISENSLVIEDDSKIFILTLNKDSNRFSLVKTIDSFISYYLTNFEDDKFIVVSKLVGNNVSFVFKGLFCLSLCLRKNFVF